jgi:excisionase family DNA binding protein
MGEGHSTPGPEGSLGRRRRLLRLREVAEYLGLSMDTVHRMCRDGRLPHVRIGRRIRVEPEELARWIAQRRHGPAQGRE